MKERNENIDKVNGVNMENFVLSSSQQLQNNLREKVTK